MTRLRPNAVLALIAAAKERIIDRDTAAYAKSLREKLEKQATTDPGTRKERRHG